MRIKRGIEIKSKKLKERGKRRERERERVWIRICSRYKKENKKKLW